MLDIHSWKEDFCSLPWVSPLSRLIVLAVADNSWVYTDAKDSLLSTMKSDGWTAMKSLALKTSALIEIFLIQALLYLVLLPLKLIYRAPQPSWNSWFMNQKLCQLDRQYCWNSPLGQVAIHITQKKLSIWLTQPYNWRCLSNIKKNTSIAKDPIFDSAHQKPNKKSPNPDTFKELSPSQPIGVKLKRSHDQIQNLFVLTDKKRTISCIELLNLLEFDLT